MSHTAKVKTAVTNLPLLLATCQQLSQIVERVEQNVDVRLYQRTVYKNATALHLKGWNYPVVIAEDGSIYYDNFNGAWGDIKQLDTVLQAYITALVLQLTQANNMTTQVQETAAGVEIVAAFQGGF